MSRPKNLATQFIQVRNLLQDVETDEYYKSDGYLLRWLQYSNYDVQKSALAFRHSMKWRCENRIDSILDEDFSDLALKFPVDLDGVDKHGRLIIKVFFEAFDSESFDFEGGWLHRKRLLRFAYWNQERLEKRIQEQFVKTGGTVSQCVAVIDCTKMSELIKNIGIRRLYAVLVLLKELVANLENNFPRGVCSTYVVSAPKLFAMFYSAIKHLFCLETAKAFQVHGVESSFDWEAELF